MPYKYLSLKMFNLEESKNIDVGDNNMPIITKVESLLVKDEPVFCDYIANNIKTEVCCDSLHVAVESSSHCSHKLDTENICSVTHNDYKQSQQVKIKQEISPAVDDIDGPPFSSIGRVEIKDETSLSAYDDNITIEEWNPDLQRELINKSSRCKSTIDGETETEQASRGVARLSVHAGEHSHEHTDNSSTSRKQVAGEDVKGNVNRDDSVKSLIPLYDGEKPYKCDLCRRHFKQERDQKNHMRKHTGDKSYKCDICMKCFTYKTTYNAHKHKHDREKPYKCEVCMKCFSRNGEYTRHLVIHTGEKPYKCDVCRKCFRYKSNYNEHIRIHDEAKPYKCDICMKSFIRNAECKRHMRVHTGETPYKCDVCMKSFRNKQPLKMHMHKHSGVKPYKCDVCMKCFSDKSYYKRHMRIHTGEKPYKCDVCLKFFNEKSNYNTHIRRHN